MNRKLVMTTLATAAVFCTAVLFSPQAHAQTVPDTVTLTAAEQQQLDVMHQPEDWFLKNLKGPRETADGAVLDARLQYVLENVTRPAAALQPAIRAAYQTEAGRANGRAMLERYWLIRTASSAPMANVEDKVVKGRDGTDIPLRIYHPDVKGKLPVLVYYHGGGFMFGSIAGWDRTAREIANASKMIVVSVGYRLAPEHPYPAAWHDAEDAYLWTAANLKTLGGTSLSLGGDSAGGTLAIATAIHARDARTAKIKGLLLYYPGVDREGDYPSMTAFGTGYALDADNLKYLAGLVYPEGVKTTPEDTSPMQAKLCGLPAALVVSAGFDPLKDGQAAFARAYGPTAVHVRQPTLIHGFQQTSGYVPDAARAVSETAARFAAMVRTARPAKPCA